ncbi:hypothetical protein CCP4SC76_2280006 [Gammaproteobacteria bacterium]
MNNFSLLGLPRRCSTFQQNTDRLLDFPGKEKESPPTSTYLMPQHGRADAGQQQAANAVDVLRYLETFRVTLDLNTRTQIADRLCIDFSKMGQNGVVQQVMFFQQRPDLFDAIGNLREHFRLGRQLFRQVDEQKCFSYLFNKARLIGFLSKETHPTQSCNHPCYTTKHFYHIVRLVLKQTRNACCHVAALIQSAVRHYLSQICGLENPSQRNGTVLFFIGHGSTALDNNREPSAKNTTLCWPKRRVNLLFERIQSPDAIGAEQLEQETVA